MVQLKYFGDSRDFFKYDLITTIVKESSLCHYVFIPMLTKPRDDGQGNKAPRNNGDKSEDLLRFIKKCDSKSLKHWKDWLAPHVDSYSTIEPVDETYFLDEERNSYWEKFRPIISKEHALVFIDPDTGLETGGPSYLRKMGRDKYIIDDELKSLLEQISTTSVLMVYQHLPNNKHKHIDAVKEKLNQVKEIGNGKVYTFAYREDDLAFIFISKTKGVHEEIIGILKKYYKNSNHKYKSIHA